MNERREIRLRLMELVAINTSGVIEPGPFFETVLNMERFVLQAGVAESEPAADSGASETDRATV